MPAVYRSILTLNSCALSKTGGSLLQRLDQVPPPQNNTVALVRIHSDDYIENDRGQQDYYFKNVEHTICVVL